MWDGSYDSLLRALDEGRLPVVVPVRPGMLYWCSYAVQGWSPLHAGTERQREECIAAVVIYTMREAVSNAPD